MEQIKIENLSFSYPLSDKKAIDNLSLSIDGGEFILLCGKSGCGKTTLLRQLKKELAPHGEKSGKIYIDGQKRTVSSSQRVTLRLHSRHRATAQASNSSYMTAAGSLFHADSLLTGSETGIRLQAYMTREI